MKIIILGSGFSKAFCKKAPTIKSIHSNMKNLGIINEIDRIKRFGITDEETISSILLDGSYENSFLEINHNSKIRYEYLKEISDQISLIKADNSALFKKFIEKYLLSNTKNEKIIITLNYDTLIEDNVENYHSLIKIKTNPYDSDQIINISSNYLPEVNLLKVHGSVNWFKYSNYDTHDIEKIYECNRNDDSFENIKKYNNPVFIPFAFTKSEYLKGNLFSCIWQKFTYLLEESDEIEIIGYSFPKTDYQIALKLLNYFDRIKKITIKEDINNITGIFGEKVVINDALREYPV